MRPRDWKATAQRAPPPPTSVARGPEPTGASAPRWWRRRPRRCRRTCRGPPVPSRACRRQRHGGFVARAEAELFPRCGRLHGDVQIAVRPGAEPAGRGRDALRAKRGPAVGDQLLPLPIGWRARQGHHARYPDREAERPLDGRRAPAGGERLGRTCDAGGRDAHLLPDALELIQGQPAGFNGGRGIVGIAGRREAENLAHLVVPVSPWRHSAQMYAGPDRHADALQASETTSPEHGRQRGAT